MDLIYIHRKKVCRKLKSPLRKQRFFILWDGKERRKKTTYISYLHAYLCRTGIRTNLCKGKKKWPFDREEMLSEKETFTLVILARKKEIPTAQNRCYNKSRTHFPFTTFVILEIFADRKSTRLNSSHAQ